MSDTDEPRGAPIERMPIIEKGLRETPNPSRVPYHTEKPASDESRDDAINYKPLWVPIDAWRTYSDVLAEVARQDAIHARGEVITRSGTGTLDYKIYGAAANIREALRLKAGGGG